MKTRNNWVWGRILGYEVGTKVRLVCNHPVLKNEIWMRSPGFLDFIYIEEGTEGVIVKVLNLKNLKGYLVDFPDYPNTFVLEEEIEPGE